MHFSLPSSLLLLTAGLSHAAVPSRHHHGHEAIAERMQQCAEGCRMWNDAADGKYVPTLTDYKTETKLEPLVPVCNSTTNGPHSRSCWSEGFNISTNTDISYPNTNVTRHYTLTITNGTAAPDGISRRTFLVNGQYPGPAIYADWGDTLEIRVVNLLQHNGTGIHWHGVRLWREGWMDGVPGVTECPIPPGGERVYRYRVSQFGTSWWHSHVGVQYGDGVMGLLVVNGPTTANYDEDLGVLPISDWYYETASTRSYIVQHTFGRPPTMADNGLINGTMVSKNGTGKYALTHIQYGKRYKLRLINTGLDNHFVVTLDNHAFQVVAADFVPIVPFWTNNLFLAIGQRYDVIVNADQEPGSYWFRAEVQDQAGPDCGLNANNGNIKSIFRYAGAPKALPESMRYEYPQRCADETGIVPYRDTFVPKGPIEKGGTLNTSIDIGVDSNNSTLVKWGINTVAMNVNWDKPILGHVFEGNTTFARNENVITLDKANEWYYWLIQSVPGTPVDIQIPHPMHLHGHDFYILGSGLGNFSLETANLNYDNPTRRDTTMLPAGGWVAVAFKTDNPGGWLMHCHIAWHVEQGMAVQFLETYDLKSMKKPVTSYQQQCKAWNKYYPEHAVYYRGEGDSGL